MFGMGGLFDSSGGDENAGAMSGESPNLQNTGGGNYAGAYPSQTDAQSQSQNEDPALQATMDAQFQSNATTQSAQANEMASQINNGSAGGNALMTGLFSLFDSKAKRVASNQRKYARAQAEAAIENASRARDQYAADSSQERQKLSQSYSGRGIGESSIKDEGMQYFNDTAARKAAELDQNVMLANMGQRLTNSQISASYAQPYMHVIGGILNMV